MKLKTKLRHSQSGVAHLLPILLIILIVGVGFAGWRVMQSEDSGDGAQDANNSQQSGDAEESDQEPPVLAKNIGFNFDTYNPATKMAGDFKFSALPALSDPLVGNQLWMDYGVPDPKPGSTMKNGQTIFILPAGTKITAMVDGEVVALTEFGKDDYGIMIAKDKSSKWRYEHEHVTKPTVKLGDKVKAGDVIAEVAQHTNTWQYAGHGLFEIGLYRARGNNGGGSEDCVFKFLDPSVKQDIQAKVSALYTAWEDFRGDTSIYDQENYASPGCAISDTISWDTPMVPGSSN